MDLNKRMDLRPPTIEPDVKPKTTPTTKPDKNSPWSVPVPRVNPKPKAIKIN